MTRRGPRAALALTALIVAGCLGKTTDSTAPVDIMSPGKWVELAPMPTARQEVAVALAGWPSYLLPRPSVVFQRLASDPGFFVGQGSIR